MSDFKKLNTESAYDTNSQILKSSIYSDFLAKLTPEKIKLFNWECKKKQLNLKQTKLNFDHSCSKLPKEHFLNILNSMFGNDLRKSARKDQQQDKMRKTDNKEKIISILFEKLFTRFKTVKCEISLDRNKINPAENFYHINELNTEQLQEIDIYEFSCALCIYLRIDFKDKLKLLFELTDSDEDGYINESEIKNFIFTVNFIFSDEDPSHKTDSSVINQSLNHIKSSRILESIIKFPGELRKVLSLEKYVNLDQLYESISKIENFKHIVIPSFINLENSLNTKKSEPVLEISERNLNEYLQIINENVSVVKESNNEIFFKTKAKDLKKMYDAKRELELNKTTKKKKEFINENKKNIKNNTKQHNQNFFNSVSCEFYKNTLPIIAKPTRSEKEKSLPKFFIKENIENDYFSINFNKILNLEAQPGRIKLKDIFSKERDISNNVIITDDSKENGKNLNYKATNHQNNFENSFSRKHFVLVNDILNEINQLSNKNTVSHFEDSEEIKKLLSQSIQTANYLKRKFTDTSLNSNLSFGKI